MGKGPGRGAGSHGVLDLVTHFRRQTLHMLDLVQGTERIRKGKSQNSYRPSLAVYTVNTELDRAGILSTDNGHTYTYT